MLSISILLYNIVFIICFYHIKKVNGAQSLCESSSTCSSVVTNAMQENKPLDKKDYAYLVLKFEQIKYENYNGPSIEDEENNTNTNNTNNSSTNKSSNINSNTETNANTNNNAMSRSEKTIKLNKGNIIKKVENKANQKIEINKDVDESETVTFVNKENNISLPTEVTPFVEQDIPTYEIFMEDGEYGDDELESETTSSNEEIETTSLTNEEIETISSNNEEIETDIDKETETDIPDSNTIIPRQNLIKRNSNVVEQRFSQFFVPINEYSVLKLKNVKSLDWNYEYIYVGLVHNKKVYYTHFPLRWGNDKGCVDDRSVIITLEDGNYKNIEWSYTSCRAKVCKYQCINDEINDEKGSYNRCANQQINVDKCDINIYIGWAGTDKNGDMLLDSSQPIYEIKNTL